MPWFALARVVVVGAVAYSAAALQPLPFGVVINTAFAVVLAALVVLFETRLRETQVTRLLGGLIGFITGIAIARAIEAGFFWLNAANGVVEFFNSFLLIVLPYLGLMRLPRPSSVRPRPATSAATFPIPIRNGKTRRASTCFAEPPPS